METLTLEEISNKYIITKKGKCFGKTYGRELSYITDRNGYLRVNLWINGKAKQMGIHRLVAIFYIDNPDNKPQVNHINGIKHDNKVENLEWVTNKENIEHAVENLLHKHQKISVLKNGILIGIYNSSTHASKDLNLDQSSIISCANGKRKTTKGYTIHKL